MRAAEEAAFASGVEVEALMDRAGAGIARAVSKFFPGPGKAIVFAGKGHNGGDALVAAALLKEAGWEIDLRLIFPEEDCAELTRKKIADLRRGRASARPRTCRSTSLTFLRLDRPRRLAGPRLETSLARAGAHRGAGDQSPSPRRKRFRFRGRSADRLRWRQRRSAIPDCVVADFTITIGFAKHGLVVDHVIDLVGRLEIVPLADLVIAPGPANDLMACAHSLRSLLPRRKFSAYKNEVGRIGVVAGIARVRRAPRS